MAVLLEITLPAEFTEDAYNAVNSEMGVEANPPEGLIQHIGVRGGNGVVVYDLWESRADFDKFAETTLGAAIAKVAGGDTPAIEPKELEVINTFGGPGS